MKRIGDFNFRTDVYYDVNEGYWLVITDDIARIGLTPLVQETSGSFVAIKMSNLGTEITKGDSIGSIEAEKHVGHLKAPLSGTITALNEKVLENPRLINTDSYGKGWLMEIEMTNVDLEKKSLLTGEENIISWLKSEVEKYKEKGWLATP
ncbi:MAG: glycine cleavage system protein H [Saprospiraceae bacterium]